MSDQSQAAVAIPPTVEPVERDQAADRKPKRQPLYGVIVFNDDEHSFQFVMETFMKVFGYTIEKSYALVLQIHHGGRGIVWSGPLEVAEFKRDQVRSAGPDCYAQKKVGFPLGVAVEPLPG